ncbi:MAG: helix-turn-helix transcriptional regulator [Lachnospiraceae bacterium]|nr:helix-turn-helix transcriptional regulator [Lachnospiraceae bacterium]
MAVTNNLKDIREERGLIQKDLADATGFSIRTISRVERLEQPPSGEFMLRVASYFHLLVEDMFAIEND